MGFLVFPRSFYIYLYIFLRFSLLPQSFYTTHLILPAITLSFFYACSVVFSQNVGVSFVYFLQDAGAIWVLMYVNVFQCLQRIWKKASGRWRGSCSSWSETLRLLPPRMTQTTCSSRKWLYPLHMHACMHAFGCMQI